MTSSPEIVTASESDPASLTSPAVQMRERALWAVLLALTVVVVVLGVRGYNELRGTQREFARRIAEVDTRGKALEQSQREGGNELAEALKRVNALEARVAESQSQQAALEQLYQELSRNRDDVQLAEIEQLVMAAAQQLQLFANVQAALITLQNVDARLARVDKPQFLGVRRAITHDLERLR
ncbi:MAG TPA: uroporphyrinogen-III C-methyltransferase, partial [Burkholderiaceae bacterium]|nr:uroporphyrinogen-III C-methyltransferase [Burkholderiaceae bacterium]